MDADVRAPPLAETPAGGSIFDGLELSGDGRSAPGRVSWGANSVAAAAAPDGQAGAAGGNVQARSQWKAAGSKVKMVSALSARPVAVASGTDSADESELLMPTLIKSVSTAERTRHWIWWGSLSTAYANFLIYLANHRDIIDLPEFWAANRDALMALNDVSPWAVWLRCVR